MEPTVTTGSDPLATYRAKRDFAVTSEPAGAIVDGRSPAPKGASRFVVQRHRATRLHYDLRLEVNGVLVSWAVPKGPTLDPAARRLAVHVEDHPLEYFDFEGVIPKGEYGAGDVIVWDWGTWSGVEDEKDAARAIAEGELHFDLAGAKLKGRFVLVRPERGDGSGGGSGKEQWLLLHKHDDEAVPGWDPEDHPRSVKTGRTNDEVKAGVAGAPDVWTRDRPTVAAWAREHSWSPPTDDELAALDALGRGGIWTFQKRELRLTNLDKVLFPGREGETPVTKRDLVRYYACAAPVMLPYFSGRPVNLNRYPEGSDRPGFWHKAFPEHAPDWFVSWRNEEADDDETRTYSVLEEPAALAWMANYGALELHPWTSRIEDVHRPTWALIDIDPGTSTSFADVLVMARLYRAALEHLGVLGMPKVTGKRGVQIWVPVASRYTFDDTRAWVEKVSRAVGGTVPELVNWAWHKADRQGRARLDYTQNAINKTLVGPFSARPAPGAPVSVTIRWDELDDPDMAPDRWTVRTALDRIGEAGDPLAALVGLQQVLPEVG